MLPGTTHPHRRVAVYQHLGSAAIGTDRATTSRREYVSPTGATVNSIEGFWAMLKRGINGTHIHVSAKHLPKYLGEFEYRWNMRQVPHLMLDRLMHSFAR